MCHVPLGLSGHSLLMSLRKFVLCVSQGKCDQYWPDSNTKYGSIRVTLQKTENFADYVVRTFTLVKVRQGRIRNIHHHHLFAFTCLTNFKKYTASC